MTVEQFTDEFEAVRGQLKSYLLRITACVSDTEDIVQDTYLRAVGKINSFKGDSALKTWLFAIATNIAKDNQRAKKRWTEDVTDIARSAAMADIGFFNETMEIINSSPQAKFEIKEHVAFCFTCISKSLPLEQQLCIFLKEVYEFKVVEIAEILEDSEAMVKYYLHAARSKMIDIFGRRCALINKKGICHQCTELNGIYNPKQNNQEALMKVELANAMDNPDKEYLLDLRMNILQNIDPFESKAAALQLHHLEFNRRLMEV